MNKYIIFFFTKEADFFINFLHFPPGDVLPRFFLILWGTAFLGPPSTETSEKQTKENQSFQFGIKGDLNILYIFVFLIILNVVQPIF